VNVLLVFNFGPPGTWRRRRTPSSGNRFHHLRTQVLPTVEFRRKEDRALGALTAAIATMYLYQTGKLKLTKADIRRGRTTVDGAALRSGNLARAGSRCRTGNRPAC